MKKYFAKNLILRGVSLLIPVVLCVICVCRGIFSERSLCACLLASSFLFLFYPMSFELIRKSFPYVFGQSVIFVLLALSPIFPGNECLLVTVSFIPAFVGYTLMRSAEKYYNVKLLFRVDATWCAVEDHARMVYAVILGAIVVSTLTSCRYEAPAWVFFIHVFLLVLYVAVCYLRAYTGSTFLIGYEKERLIRKVIQGNLRTVPEFDGPDDHMNMVYSKVLRFMESCRPFLDSRFTIEEMADAVFSNKVYLSKAINYYSGRNFRQFINYYRVMYATELMKKDRHLKVTELALKCGFNSVVTFNAAFKLNMNMTPSAYYGMLSAKATA